MQNLKKTYSDLPKDFHRSIDPMPVIKPKLICLNHELANDLSIDTTDEIQLLQYFSGNEVPEKSSAIAMAYAGHQFGNFVPQLGDGRAMLIGELYDNEGKLKDIQLKGSGVTAFSRQGDGRSAIGPVIREYIISEAMHAMNIPTTRALAAVSTGEHVFRETALKGGILTRVSNSLVRVGTFEFFRARQDFQNLRVLSDFTIDRLYPEISEEEDKYLSLFNRIAKKQSILISKWMGVGFIHGVMNTDNCSISGETIDYGPCAFMDEYDPNAVFSSIDRQGRYRFNNQPKIALWNLSCLAGCLMPIIQGEQEEREEKIQASLEETAKDIDLLINEEMVRKIGLEHSDESETLLQDLLKNMYEDGSDFTLTFRSLIAASEKKYEGFLSNFKQAGRAKEWLKDWERIINNQKTKDQNNLAEKLRLINPIYIPRNHLIEKAIKDIENNEDDTFFYQLLEATSKPYLDQNNMALLSLPPEEEERVTQTFCGT